MKKILTVLLMTASSFSMAAEKPFTKADIQAVTWLAKSQICYTRGTKHSYPAIYAAEKTSRVMATKYFTNQPKQTDATWTYAQNRLIRYGDKPIDNYCAKEEYDQKMYDAKSK